jgi:hypothetical protein
LTATKNADWGRLIVRFVLGMLAIFSGVAIIGWICYNEFVERLPQYQVFIGANRLESGRCLSA